MKRRGPALIAATLLLAAALPAGATKLDLFSDVELKAVNYQHLPYGAGRVSQPLNSENAALGFIIKNIRLEKTPESTMDVGIVLQSVGQGASSDTVRTPQFTDAAARLANTDGTPFVRDAYVRIYKFLRPNITATFGRQEFTLGQGISLGSDDLGLPGGRLEMAGLLRNIKADLFFFRPFLTDRYLKVYGGSAYYPASEGLWQVYHFWEQDDAPGADTIFNTLSRTKKYTGLRYVLVQSQLSFDGEAVVERGSAKLAAGGKGKYEGHAFMLKGAWNQNIGFFGQSKLRIGYGRSSGNPASATTTDKAFFPAFGSRYDGLERKGYGAIAGASLYDIIKTSDTVNGLPHGVSGLNIINIGADLPYKKLLLSADLYKFRASRNASGGSLQIASEYDLKAAYAMGEDLTLSATYAVFTPLGLYPTKTPAKLVSAAVSARF